MEQYWMWLCSVPGLYCRQIRTLTEYFGSPKEVYRAPEREFEVWREKNLVWIEALLRFRKRCSPEQVCHKAAVRGIQFISCESGLFPRKLKSLSDYPAGLFYMGSLPDPEAMSVAVVGARSCSNYGRSMAREIGSTLARAGVQVVSGLALGVDGAAQRAAVGGGGKSFGILGCGIDICYPKEHFDLYQKIQSQGGILSEFPLGTQPMARHFPMRNRIISGLCDAVVVVEARGRSGSLITADLALEQGRDVYAVPGRSGDVLSEGTNRLIAQGAGIVVSVDALLKELNLGGTKEKFSEKNKLLLAPEEKWVYINLDLLPKNLEEIAMETEIAISRLGGILLCLERKGLAAEVSKNYYARLK